MTESDVPRVALVALGARGERGQVEAGRPAFGVLDQLVDLGVLELQRGGAQQHLGLAPAEGELVRPELEQRPAGPQRGHRQVGQDPTGEHDHRPGRDVPDERSDGRDRVVRQRVRAVEHEHERRAARGDRRAEALQCLGRRGPALGGQRLERRLRQRLDPVERGGDEAQERDRVVVALVDRDPGERTHVARRPLREQRRLAVAGRRHHQHQREGARRAQAVDQRRPRDRARQERRNAGLRVGDLERQRWRARGTDEHGLRPRPAQACAAGISRCGNARELDHPEASGRRAAVRRHSGLPSWRTWDPLARVCEVAAISAIRGSADCPAANTVQITTICRPGCTGLSCRFRAPLRYWLRDMYCCRNRTGRGGARGFFPTAAPRGRRSGRALPFSATPDRYRPANAGRLAWAEVVRP